MSRARVLVIEDNELNMELVVTLVERSGYSALKAWDAQEGISLARAEMPHLILMDIGLPGMDGLEATGVLKGDPETKHIPVVALTAHAMKGDREKMLAAGCDGYIEKPFDTRAFPETIAGFLHRHGNSHAEKGCL